MWPKFKIFDQEVPKDSLDHAQSQDIQSDLFPQPTVLVGSEFGSPPDEVRVILGADHLQHHLSDSEKSGINSSQQTSSPLRTDVSSVHVAGNLDEIISVPAKRSRDLWKEAFAKLDDDEKELLSTVEQAEASKIVEEVATLTKARYREHEERGWKITRGKGKGDINLRIAARKILSSVLWTKDLIDHVVAFDATGYASIAWSMVSFGLQMVKNDMDRLESMFEACGTLTDTLTLCAAIDASHRDQPVPDSSHLEEAIIGVYVVTLKFSAEIHREINMKVGQKILSSITSLEERSLQGFLKLLYSKEQALSRWTQVIQHQYRKGENKAISEKVDGVLAGIEDMAVKVLNIEARAITDEDNRVLDWLSDYRFFESQKEASVRRDASTAAWILDSLEYKNWKEPGAKLLWLYGKSGCGKSVLCSEIIEDLRELCDRDWNYVKAYWYLNFNIQASLDMDNLLCSLIKQLCDGTQTLSDDVREHWRKHRNEGPTTIKHLLPAILDSIVGELRMTGREVAFVSDALDEYPLPTRGELLRWLQELCGHHDNIHILITSRDETDLRECFGKAANWSVAECVIQDVQVFIEHSVDEILRKATWKERWRRRIHEAIERISDRRFRWASLMKDNFSDCLDDDAMEQAVIHLPNSVEAMCAKILTERIYRHENKSNKIKARLIFTWLTYSIRPLTLWELACAASLPDPRKVLEICTSSLVTLQREGDGWPALDNEDSDIWGTKVVHFDHFSVKEFLTSEHLLESGETAYFYASPLLGHLTIAEFLVGYLLKASDVYLATRESIRAKRVEGGYEFKEDFDAQSQHVNPWKDANQISQPSKQYWPHDASSWAELWPKFALLDYTVSWYEHVQQADAIEKSTDQDSENEMREPPPAAMLPDPEYLRSQIHRFFGDKVFLQLFENWAHLCPNLMMPNSTLPHLLARVVYILKVPPSPLWLASLLNLPDNVRRLLRSGHSVDELLGEPASTTETALPARIEANAGNMEAWGYKPVQIAAFMGNLEALDVLLDNNAVLKQSELEWVTASNHVRGPAVLNIIFTARPHLVVTQDTVKAAKENRFPQILRYFQNTPDLFDPSGDNLMDLNWKPNLETLSLILYGVGLPQFHFFKLFNYYQIPDISLGGIAFVSRRPTPT